jgi:hypothetical protein
MPDQTSPGDPKNNTTNQAGLDPSPTQRTPIEPLEGGVSSAVKIEKTETSDIGAQEAREQASISNQALVDRINRSDRWMIALTAIIAIGGAISAFLFWKHLQAFQGQLEAMRGQLHEMTAAGKQTDELIAANKKVAEAASKSAEAAKRSADSIESSQRAWAAPVNGKLKAPLGTSDEIVFMLDIQNVGKEPAFDATYQVGDSLTPIPAGFDNWVNLPVGKIDTCADILPIPGNPSIFPSGGLSTNSSGIVYSVRSPAEHRRPISEIVEKKFVLSIYGCIAYKTANSVHHTAFCYYIEPAKEPPANWPIKNCPQGNKAT